MKKTYFVSCQFLGSNGLLREENFFLDEVEIILDNEDVQCLGILASQYLIDVRNPSLFELSHLKETFKIISFCIVHTKEYQIPWDQIMALNCSSIYKEIFQRLFRVNNTPMNRGELIGGVFNRLQSANQILKLSGIPYSIRPIEGYRGDAWKRHYRLVPR